MTISRITEMDGLGYKLSVCMRDAKISMSPSKALRRIEDVNGRIFVVSNLVLQAEEAIPC